MITNLIVNCCVLQVSQKSYPDKGFNKYLLYSVIADRNIKFIDYLLDGYIRVLLSNFKNLPNTFSLWLLWHYC